MFLKFFIVLIIGYLIWYDLICDVSLVSLARWIY